MAEVKTRRIEVKDPALGLAKDFSCFTLDVTDAKGQRIGFVFSPSEAPKLYSQMQEILRKNPGFGSKPN